MRRFEQVKPEAMKYGKQTVQMPKRATHFACAYDFYSPISVTIKAGECVSIFTNIKAKMEDDDFLLLANRSGNGMKGIVLKNTIGLIDKDYYGNPTNDGNMCFALQNNSGADFVVNEGDRIGQGCFIKYYLTEDDNVADVVRTGGFGSTGQK